MPRTVKEKLGVIKTQITKKSNEIQTFIADFNKETLSSRDVKKVDQYLEDIETLGRELSQEWRNLQKDVEDQTVVNEIQTELDAYETKVEKSVDELEKFLEKTQPQPSNQNSETSDNQNRSQPLSSGKIDDTLKPGLLLKSMTLEEFNNWSDAFRAYFSHNQKTLEKQDF